jgi:hypothetical protein
MSDATCVSRIVRNTRSKPADTACRGPFAVCSSSLIRSKIKTLESTPIPIVRMNPAMPGSVIVAPIYAINPSRRIRFTTIETSALMPDNL